MLPSCVGYVLLILKLIQRFYAEIPASVVEEYALFCLFHIPFLFLFIMALFLLAV